MSENITYESPNGYTGILFGEKSYKVLKDGKEVFHTHHRNINTYDELVECVEGFPKFMEYLAKGRKAKENQHG